MIRSLPPARNVSTPQEDPDSVRLIRSTQDRGVVAVLDSRLANANYGTIIRNSMPPLWYSTDTEAVLGALTRLDVELGATGDAAR